MKSLTEASTRQRGIASDDAAPIADWRSLLLGSLFTGLERRCSLPPEQNCPRKVKPLHCHITSFVGPTVSSYSSPAAPKSIVIKRLLSPTFSDQRIQ